MKDRRKYFICLLLFAVLFHASLSALFFFPVKRMLEKKLASIFENEHELIDIYFTKAEFTSVRQIHSKEFVFKGEFYDIKAKTLRNDTIFLKVYHDKQEKSIFSHLRNMMEKSDDGNQKKQTLAFFKMFDVFLSNSDTPNSLIASEIKNSFYANSCIMTSQLSIENNTPPPDFMA
jgi:hypothetical protein